MKNIYIHLFNALKNKQPLALASIIEAKGSTPQKPGASALFSPEGLLEGTLGGGLLEADARKKAIQALKKSDSRLYKFCLNAESSSEEKPICGGEVRILIDADPEKHIDAFQSLSNSLGQRRFGLLATFINRLIGEEVTLLRYWIEEKKDLAINLRKHFSCFREEIKKALSEGSPRLVKVKDEILPAKAKESFLFLEPVFPFPHLVIAGAGHIGQALAHLGGLLNFEVTLIDDRPEYANKERFPDADHIIVKDFNNALRDFPISLDTYLVIATHEHRHDATVLRQCINSEAAYIGMIGSTRKIELMQKKFLEEGWAAPGQFDRIYAPIGLAINSKTVEEIAISIASQLVLVRSQIRDKIKDIR